MCTLRPADGRSAYLVTYDAQRSAGEANITMAMVTPRGDLRVAFHRGAFLDAEATRRAAESVADAVHDIWADVGPSFEGLGGRELPPPTRTAADMMVHLERPSDEPGFADLVAAVLRTRNPEQAHAVVVVHDTQSAHPTERHRYELAFSIDPDGRLADNILTNLSEHGTDTSFVERSVAFDEMRRVRVAGGEALVTGGSFPAFVYIPRGPGLTVHPTGGYRSTELHPWVPVGLTGAVRKAPRNAEVVAEHDVDVLMIPSEEFVAAWLRPLEPHQLRERLARRVAPRA